MFATYDKSNFPLVKVFFNGSIKDDTDFKLFTEPWIQLCRDKQKFHFEFDMSNIGLIDPIYCYKMSSFISDIKKEKENYLEKSIIMNVGVITYGLLRIIFLIQSPVSPVIIQYNGDEILINP